MCLSSTNLEIQQEIIHKIQAIFESYGLTPQTDLAETVKTTFEKKENNLRMFCNSSEGDFVFKYELGELSTGKKQTGARAKMNLSNEIRFYERTRDIDYKGLIIPKYKASSTNKEVWLLIKKLDLERIHIFKAQDGFTNEYIPEFLIDPLIRGIDELHKSPIDKQDFNVSYMDDISAWLESCGPAFTGKVESLQKMMSDFSKRYKDIWNKQLKYIVHSDLMTDTIGYDKETHKLMILDFEKSQISNHGFDFAALVRDPLAISWRTKFEERLFDYYSDKDFEITYLFAAALRTIAGLSNFKTGRIDYVFVGILGEKEFQRIKPLFIDLWEKQLIEYVEKISPRS